MDIIKAFKEIRDIPYRIPLALDEPDDCCTGKANRLLHVLEENGYETRYRVCSFLWSETNLPKELLAIPHDDACTHTYLEVKIGDDWKTVDPTWDSGLKGLLPIEEWDGVSDTGIGLPVKSIFSPEESLRVMQESLTGDAFAEDMRKSGKFYEAMNDLFVEYRKKV